MPTSVTFRISEDFFPFTSECEILYPTYKLLIVLIVRPSGTLGRFVFCTDTGGDGWSPEPCLETGYFVALNLKDVLFFCANDRTVIL